MKKRYISKQYLRCNRLTAHFFTKLPSDICWLCKIGFPPKRVDYED